MTSFATATDLRRVLVSTIAALLLSTTCIVAAVGPAQAASVATVR